MLWLAGMDPTTVKSHYSRAQDFARDGWLVVRGYDLKWLVVSEEYVSNIQLR